MRWLKRLLLPFEDPAHPLYADPAEMQKIIAEDERWASLTPEEREAELEAEWMEYEHEYEEKMRAIFGEGYVQQMRRMTGRE